MTKKKKNDRIFKSNYGGGNVTPAQYIVELICTKKALMSKQTLSYKFWQTGEWSIVFRRWVKPVNKLLRQYDAMAIIGALNDKRSGMKWSMHTEFMINLIKEHNKKIKKNKREVKVDTQEIEKTRNSIPREPQQGVSLANLLDADIETLDMAIGGK